MKTVKQIQDQRTIIIEYAIKTNRKSFIIKANKAYRNICLKINFQRGYNHNFLLNDYDNKMYHGVLFKTV